MSAILELSMQKELHLRYAHRPLQGQKALVTGANSGIGESVARHLAAAGATVVINYVSKSEAANKIVSEIEDAGGEAMAIQADVSKEYHVQAMFREMFRDYGT